MPIYFHYRDSLQKKEPEKQKTNQNKKTNRYKNTLKKKKKNKPACLLHRCAARKSHCCSGE